MVACLHQGQRRLIMLYNLIFSHQVWLYRVVPETGALEHSWTINHVLAAIRPLSVSSVGAAHQLIVTLRNRIEVYSTGGDLVKVVVLDPEKDVKEAHLLTDGMITLSDQ